MFLMFSLCVLTNAIHAQVKTAYIRDSCIYLPYTSHSRKADFVLVSSKENREYKKLLFPIVNNMGYEMSFTMADESYYWSSLGRAMAFLSRYEETPQVHLEKSRDVSLEYASFQDAFRSVGEMSGSKINARKLVEPITDWIRSHGGVYAANGFPDAGMIPNDNDIYVRGDTLWLYFRRSYFQVEIWKLNTASFSSPEMEWENVINFVVDSLPDYEKEGLNTTFFMLPDREKMKVISPQFPFLSGSNFMFQSASGQLFIYNDKLNAIYLIGEDILEVARVDRTVTFLNNNIIIFDRDNDKILFPGEINFLPSYEHLRTEIRSYDKEFIFDYFNYKRLKNN